MDTAPFGTLSAELRNTIYEMVLSDHNKIRSEHTVTKFGKHKKITPPIAQVCSQMRNECLLMSFAETTFQFNLTHSCIKAGYSDLRRFHRWFLAVDPRCHAVIPKIKIKLKVFEQGGRTQWGTANAVGTRDACWLLAKALRDRKYGKDRLDVELEVRVRSTGNDTVAKAVAEVFAKLGIVIKLV